MHLYSLTVYSFSNNNAETHKNAACRVLIYVFGSGLQLHFVYHLSVEQIDGSSGITGIMLRVRYHNDGCSLFMSFCK